MKHDSYGNLDWLRLHTRTIAEDLGLQLGVISCLESPATAGESRGRSGGAISFSTAPRGLPRPGCRVPAGLMSDLGLLAIGVDSDPAMVHFVRACQESEDTLNAINLREVVLDGNWRFVISERGSTRGTIWRGPNKWDLHDFKSLYCRPINLATDRIPSQRARWHGLIAGLTAWADQAPFSRCQQALQWIPQWLKAAARGIPG